MVKCPCCGYDTLVERVGYEICYLCNWEDDGQDDPHADEVWGGPNGDYSLSEARENFQKYGIMYRPTHTSKFVESPKKITAKKNIIKAFEKIETARNDKEKGKYWRRIGKNRNILWQELLKRIRTAEERVYRPRIDERLECVCCGYGTLSRSRWGQFCYLCGWHNDEDSRETSVSDRFGTRVYQLEKARKNFEEHFSILDVHDPKYYTSIKLVTAKKNVIELLGDIKDSGHSEEERIKDEIWNYLTIILEENDKADDLREFRLNILGLYEELS